MTTINFLAAFRSDNPNAEAFRSMAGQLSPDQQRIFTPNDFQVLAQKSSPLKSLPPGELNAPKFRTSDGCTGFMLWASGNNPAQSLALEVVQDSKALYPVKVHIGDQLLAIPEESNRKVGAVVIPMGLTCCGLGNYIAPLIIQPKGHSPQLYQLSSSGSKGKSFETDKGMKDVDDLFSDQSQLIVHDANWFIDLGRRIKSTQELQPPAQTSGFLSGLKRVLKLG